MEKPQKKVRYIFPIILILVFVFLLFLLRFFVTKFFLIQTFKNPALIYTSKFSDLDESSLETEIFNEITDIELIVESEQLIKI